MFSTITSGAVYGIKSCPIQVEVDVSQGLPCFQIVGLPGSEVREARERVKVALKNVGVSLPPACINVNLSPADIPKSGTMFDLPVAVGIMAALSKLPPEPLKNTLFIGELGLSGELKPVKGVLPIVREAARGGVKRCIVPRGNLWESALVEDVESIGVSDMREAIEILKGTGERRKESGAGICKVSVGETACGEASSGQGNEEYRHGREGMEWSGGEPGRSREDFADISGQDGLKRAAEVCAAGFHHLLVVGAPGSGKTMLARRIPSVLPPLTLEESMEVSSVYSVSGLLQSTGRLKTERPFLNPHHTITGQALVGGGRIPKPGIVSLAHRGILFLDELPEFKRETLDILRQPLEDREVQIARSSGAYVYPADFMLVGAMNPCPCGYYPDMSRCRCTPGEVRRYLRRVSGPILDRIDVCVEARPVGFGDIAGRTGGESSSQVRARVMAARKIQTERYAGTDIRFNSDLKAAQVERFCSLGAEERRFMERMFTSMKLTARGYHRILKVARTAADLAGAEKIGEEHLAEAICYRRTEVFG